MDQEDKRRFQERVQRAFAKHRSYDEQKRVKAEARRRKVGRGRRPRRRGIYDDGDGIESMRSAHVSARAVECVEGEPAAPTPAAARVGLVVGLARSRVRLATPDGERSVSLLPGLAAEEGLAIAVGDRVAYEERAGVARLLAVEPRTSVLARPDPARPGRRRLLAANVDLVACVVAARAPRWKPGFVDRVLLAAEEGGCSALAVVNKVDLLAPEERAGLAREVESLTTVGVPVLPVSVASGAGLGALGEALAGRTVVFVGPSGVGKSSLQNALDPGRERATGAVRASDGKGRHTTTATELVQLGRGTRLIDTPGVRQFGLAGIDRRELGSMFPEFQEPARHCRFRDCSHLVEPGCGVRKALEEGRIAGRRFAAYARIHGSLRE